jgi:hypothetical protein
MKLLNFLNKLSLGQVLAIAVILDVLWATLVATFGASVLHILGVAGGAGATALGVGTILGWLTMFVIAFLQGAVFIVALGIFALVIFAFLSKK